MLAILAELAKTVIGGWVETHKAKVQAAVKRAQTAQDDAAEWQRLQIEHSDRWVRRLSFVIWSTPIIWAVFSPATVHAFFTQSLSAIPHWYVRGCLGVTSAVWGLSQFQVWKARAGALKGAPSKPGAGAPAAQTPPQAPQNVGP